jgi:hypothetical protein
MKTKRQRQHKTHHKIPYKIPLQELRNQHKTLTKKHKKAKKHQKKKTTLTVLSNQFLKKGQNKRRDKKAVCCTFQAGNDFTDSRYRLETFLELFVNTGVFSFMIGLY